MADSSLTIAVSRSTHELLRDLAEKSNATITAVLDEAVRDLHRKKFWAEFNAACEAIKQAKPEVWADLRREDSVWDNTLVDRVDLTDQPHGHTQRRRPEPGEW